MDQLKPAIEDPSPLVRLQVLNLLAGGQAGGTERIVRQFAQDADPYVWAMASAFASEAK
jgi:hypothetical protein